MKVRYDSNNSGGYWWLTDQNWIDLEAAGWKVNWFRDNDPVPFWPRPDGRWLGALAQEATREGLTLGEAIQEWERITGQKSNALGCSCCGVPHHFCAYDDDGKIIGSYSPESPDEGDEYEEGEECDD